MYTFSVKVRILIFLNEKFNKLLYTLVLQILHFFVHIINLIPFLENFIEN
jgi:hypothetical protein